MNEITFKDIQKANENIVTTDIKGKDYAEVNQRIKAFRMIYPTGFITTCLMSNNDGVCVFKASVGYYDDNGCNHILGEGTAYEKENSTFINKTSYIENCETSAVGRALGMAGFGIDTSVASYEEVATAIANQDKSTEDKSKTTKNTKKTETKPETKTETKPVVEPTNTSGTDTSEYNDFDITGIENEVIDKAKVTFLKKQILERGMTVDFVLNTYKTKKLEELKNKFFMHIINNWDELKRRYDKA